jgi:hypothetical protein
MQMQVVGRPYQHSDEKATILVAQTKKLGPGKKRLVKFTRGMEPPVWTIGFESHDQKGYVFKDPVNKEWVFFRREEECPIYARPLTKLYSDGTPRHASMHELLEIGMMNERELTRLLRPMVKPLNVYSLPMSGAHTKGSDVLVTWHEELDFTNPMDAVRRSLWSISCVNLRKGQLEYNTPIKEWYERCVQDKVPAVVNWVENRYEINEKYWFVILRPHMIDVFNKRSTATSKLEKYKIPVEKFVIEVRKVL